MAEQQEFADCTSWLFAFTKAMNETPVAPSLGEAIKGLDKVGIDLDEFAFILENERDNMAAKLKFKGLEAVEIDHALSIYGYTLDNPSVYKAINSAMFSPDRKTPEGKLGARFLACLPFIRFLDFALLSLPEKLRFRGTVYRGIKHAFPSPQNHKPEDYFFVGRTFNWFEFKSASKLASTMYHDNFCGLTGPRTIFILDAILAYDITSMSAFGEAEAEVILRPGTKVRVVSCAKLNDPLCRNDPNGGFPDNVCLQQLTGGHEYPTPATLAPPGSSPAQPAAASPAAVAPAETAGSELMRWVDEWTAAFLDSARRRALVEALDRCDVSLRMLLDEDPCVGDVGLTPGQRSALARGIRLRRETQVRFDRHLNRLAC